MGIQSVLWTFEGTRHSWFYTWHFIGRYSNYAFQVKALCAWSRLDLLGAPLLKARSLYAISKPNFGLEEKKNPNLVADWRKA